MTIQCCAALAITATALSQDPWGLLAERDLRRMEQVIREDHPGPFDATNAPFRGLLAKSFELALERARKVNSFPGYTALLRWFTGRFDDDQLLVSFNVQPVNVEWPGFLVTNRAGKYIVQNPSRTRPSDGLPADGAQLISCDASTPDEWVRTKVIAYQQGIASLEADRVRFTPWMFIDDGNPYYTRPKLCSFDNHGRTRELRLNWRPIPYQQAADSARRAAFGSLTPTFGARNFGPSGEWLSLPSFAPQTDQELAALRQIVNNAANYREKDPIVLDLRRNTAGNVFWGLILLRNLYGEEYADIYAREYKHVEREFRVSPGNLEFYKTDRLRRNALEFGEKSDPYTDGARIAAAMERALKDGMSTLREPSIESRDRVIPDASANVPNPVRGKVYVVTDGRCSDACLRFLDEVLKFPNVIHVGLPTSGDTVYGQAKTVKLPSGIASFSCPTMIRRARSRQPNVPYTPAFRFDGDIGDTAALEAWILDLNRKQSARN
jgi:hypothetical protein